MRTSILLVLLAVPAAADTLALTDGRFVTRPEITKLEDSFVVKYEHGEIVVPAAMVKEFHNEGADGTFVPETELEKKKFAKGYVPWKGRWVKVKDRERRLKKEKVAHALRMKQMQERRAWRNRVTVKTRRFIFQHVLPDETFQEYQDLFETYYDFYMKFWRVRPTGEFAKRKPTVHVYHNRDYFEQVSGAPKGVLGYYKPADKELHFYHDRENKRFTIDVMLHEANHLLTHMIDHRFWTPWWISEGMAEYFGASEWDPHTKTMTLGGVQSGRIAVLHAQIEDDKWLSLDALLSTSGMGGIGYAWAWSFCHFLLSDPRYEKRTKKYFVGLSRDKGIKKVSRGSGFRTVSPAESKRTLKKYLRVKDLKALQEEWYAYIRGPLGIDSQRGVDWGLAGHLMAIYGEDAKARKYFKRAIDRGSRDAYVHYGYAQLKDKQSMLGVALKYARKAVECDPLHAQAWSLVGKGVHHLEDKKEGMRLLELAREMDPDDNRIWERHERAKQRDIEEREKGGE